MRLSEPDCDRLDSAARAAALAACGAREPELAELLAYDPAPFDLSSVVQPVVLPLADEAFVATWQGYAEEALIAGAYPTLQRHIARLCFPIEAGISDSVAYRAATLRGMPSADMPEATGLVLREPAGVTLAIHATPAGRIPVITVPVRDDFIALVRALSGKNEPIAVPSSMGATLISGFNNWERVAAYRREWARGSPDCTEKAWREEFARLVPQRAHYQDRFIVLQEGYYSAVMPGDMGIDPRHWRDLSLTIRREHECAHYFTLRLFGAMHDRLHDELLADYAGIVAANGRFRADWFQRFLGIEDHPVYRDGGRLQNYRGKPPLSDGAFRVLQQLAQRAALAVETFADRHADTGASPAGRARMLLTLATHTIDALADAHAQHTLDDAWERIVVRWDEGAL